MDKPTLVSLTFDDGLRCQFDKAVPILDQYGFSATFFLTANTCPIHLDQCDHPAWRKIEWNANDIQLLKRMVQRGHEIGSHSVWHQIPFPSDRRFNPAFDPKFEAEESKRLIEGWMGREIPSFCYPFCGTDSGLKEAVKTANYKQARAGASGAAICPSSVDWYNLDCREKTENVGAWVQSGCWRILMYHGIGKEQDGYAPIEEREFAGQMSELAKLREAGAVEVLTFKDAADRVRETPAPPQKR